MEQSRGSQKLAEELKIKPQRHVAQILEVTQQSVSDWKLAKSKPSGENPLKLQKHLGIAPEDWYADPLPEPSTSEAPPPPEPVSRRRRSAASSTTTPATPGPVSTSADPARDSTTPRASNTAA